MEKGLAKQVLDEINIARRGRPDHGSSDPARELHGIGSYAARRAAQHLETLKNSGPPRYGSKPWLDPEEFTKAAETLFMTQPAVTFQIRQLEERFNTRLFDRALGLLKYGYLLAAIVSLVALETVWKMHLRLPSVPYRCLSNFHAWMWILTALGFGRQYLNTNSPALRYATNAVYPSYILHQTVIGLEAQAQLKLLEEKPDYILGCVGGGSNFGGLALPFVVDKLKRPELKIIGVEPAACPSMTKGQFAYDFGG